jgi:hypothetical protein
VIGTSCLLQTCVDHARTTRMKTQRGASRDSVLLTRLSMWLSKFRSSAHQRIARNYVNLRQRKPGTVLIRRSMSRGRQRTGKGLHLPVHVLVSLGGVFVGTAAALLTIPQDLSSRDALFTPALMLAVGLSTGPALACLKDPRAILRVENLIAFSPVFWLLLEPLQSASIIGPNAGQKHVQTVFLAIGLFSSGVWLVCGVPGECQPHCGSHCPGTYRPAFCF